MLVALAAVAALAVLIIMAWSLLRLLVRSPRVALERLSGATAVGARPASDFARAGRGRVR